MSDAQVFVAVVVALLALIGTVGTAVLATRQKQTTDLVNALQAEVQSLREEVGALRKRERAAEDYIDELRRHINDQKPPPPPQWPPTLVT
ncbi:MAG: hypothetical protein AB7H92_15550 [Microbacteriaceae bacterium]